jgi:hypothetical protein
MGVAEDTSRLDSTVTTLGNAVSIRRYSLFDLSLTTSECFSTRNQTLTTHSSLSSFIIAIKS